MIKRKSKQTGPRKKRRPGGDAPAARAGAADAPFSETRERLLAILFADPGRGFFAAELIGLFGAGAASVRRDLRHLAETGVLLVTRVGRRKHYQANRGASRYEELRGPAAQTAGIVDALRAALQTWGERIRLALVYGAAAGANGTATTGAIDVLLVADDVAMEEIRAAFAGAERQLARRVNPMLYTQKEFVRRLMDGNPFLAEVLAGDYLLLIGKEADVPGSSVR